MNYHHSTKTFLENSKTEGKKREMDPNTVIECADDGEAAVPLEREGFLKSESVMIAGDSVERGALVPNKGVEHRLVAAESVKQGQWCEVHGVSMGLMSLVNVGLAARKPKPRTGSLRIIGGAGMNFEEWRFSSIFRAFGASNETTKAGAPVVAVGTGDVVGFLSNKSSAEWVECEALDELVEGGWLVE